MTLQSGRLKQEFIDELDQALMKEQRNRLGYPYISPAEVLEREYPVVFNELYRQFLENINDELDEYDGSYDIDNDNRGNS